MQRNGVFARPPVPGRVKTRLAAALTPRLACDLYAACLADAVEAARGAGADERWIYWAEPTEHAHPAAGFGARLQRGDDLGARLKTAFEELIVAPGDRALILGADCPELDAARLDQAVRALERSDLVLGPTRDGGYYLIGLARAEPRLFEGVTWGSEWVLEQTRERAVAAGLAATLLEPLEDIDTPADLVRFIERACRQPGGALETRRALEAMALLPRAAGTPRSVGP